MVSWIYLDCQSAERFFRLARMLAASRAQVNFTKIGLFLSSEYFPRRMYTIMYSIFTYFVMD